MRRLHDEELARKESNPEYVRDREYERLQQKYTYEKLTGRSSPTEQAEQLEEMDRVAHRLDHLNKK